MICSGIDIVEISRFTKLIGNERFLKRVYGDEERSMLLLRGRTASFAANFAAKEAFSKALGTGVRNFRLNEVEVLRTDLGAPYLKLSGKAAEVADKLGYSFSVSISHTNELATAIVIAYKE